MTSPSTTFNDRDSNTPIMAAWLNGVNNAVYKPSLKTTIGGKAIADFSLDHSTPNSYVMITDTNPLDWAGGPGRMSVTFELISSSFFAANPSAHFVVELRQDPSLAGVNARGQAMGYGNTSGFTPPLNGVLNPTPFAETLMNGVAGAPGDHYIWPNSGGPTSFPFVDGMRYKMSIDATKTDDDLRYIRYRIWHQDLTDQQWIAEMDTGDILDNNIWADLTQSALVFAFVFESNLVPYSLNFYNTTVTWGPPGVATPDQTLLLSRFGANLQGNVQFLDAGRVIQPYYTAGPSLVGWTAFQNPAADSSTSVLVKPSGSANAANFSAINTSNPATVYQIVTYGIRGAEGIIETFHLGSSNPNLGINIGGGNRVATFSPTGITTVGVNSPAIRVTGAPKYMGQISAIYSDVTSIGGPIARAFANVGGAPFPLENFCVLGAIAGTMSTPPTPGQVENAIRPLYCLLSVLIDEIRTLRDIL